MSVRSEGTNRTGLEVVGRTDFHRVDSTGQFLAGQFLIAIVFSEFRPELGMQTSMF